MQRVQDQLDFDIETASDDELRQRFGDMANEVINKRQELDELKKRTKAPYLNRAQRRKAAKLARARPRKRDKRRHSAPVRT